LLLYTQSLTSIGRKVTKQGISKLREQLSPNEAGRTGVKEDPPSQRGTEQWLWEDTSLQKTGSRAFKILAIECRRS